MSVSESRESRKDEPYEVENLGKYGLCIRRIKAYGKAIKKGKFSTIRKKGEDLLRADISVRIGE